MATSQPSPFWASVSLTSSSSAMVPSGPLAYPRPWPHLGPVEHSGPLSGSGNLSLWPPPVLGPSQGLGPLDKLARLSGSLIPQLFLLTPPDLHIAVTWPSSFWAAGPLIPFLSGTGFHQSVAYPRSWPHLGPVENSSPLSGSCPVGEELNFLKVCYIHLDFLQNNRCLFKAESWCMPVSHISTISNGTSIFCLMIQRQEREAHL